MIGALIGDYIGSVYEHRNIKSTEFPLFSDFCRFTDDSVMSVAAADALMNGREIGPAMRRYGRMYPCAGYGGKFFSWLFDDSRGPYNSLGNGAAMRVSGAGWAAESLEEAMELGEKTALPTHNHPQGVLAARIIAGAIWLLRHGRDKKDIHKWVTENGYALDFSLDQIRPFYFFDVTCAGSVPQAITAFLESDDFESAIRLAISIGGDSDTIACIAGALAEAYYGVPMEIAQRVLSVLPPELGVPLRAFEEKYAGIRYPDLFADEILPPGLTSVSVRNAEKFWLNLSEEYSHRHGHTFPAFDVYVHTLSRIMYTCAGMTPRPVCTYDMVCVLAFFGEGMIDEGNNGSPEQYEQQLKISSGPCTLVLGSDDSSETEAKNRMLLRFEAAVGSLENDHFRSYIRRRVNTLHKQPNPSREGTSDFALLDQMIRLEYDEACACGDTAGAWRLYGLNQMLATLAYIGY